MFMSMESKKLRLPDLVAAAKEQLRQLKYTDITVRNYGYIWPDLLKFANETGVEYFSAELGERFLLEKYGVDIFLPTDAHQRLRPRGVMRLKRGVYLLADYQNYGNFKLQHKSCRVAMPEHFRGMAELFEAFCRERYYTKSSMALRMFSVKSFLLHLDHLQVRDLGGLDKSHVDDFMKTIVGWSRRTVAHRVAHIGQFLRLLHRKKVVPKDLSIFLPKVNSRRSAKLPTVWTPDQIERLLAAVDRANPIGKRDHAIILLISTLGLREGDVRELKFEISTGRPAASICIRLRRVSCWSCP